MTINATARSYSSSTSSWRRKRASIPHLSVHLQKLCEGIRGAWTYIYRRSRRCLITDRCVTGDRIPVKTISISGYNARGGGDGTAQENRVTWRTASHTCRRQAMPAAPVHDCGPAAILSSRPHALFEEIASPRARRLGPAIVRDRFGATDPRSLTSASTSRRRRQLPPAAGEQHRAHGPRKRWRRLGGPSAHTNSFDRPRAPHGQAVRSRPEKRGHRPETGVAETPTRLGGSYYVEHSQTTGTDRTEIIETIARWGAPS